jgi:rod shape-determining protein MreC
MVSTLLLKVLIKILPLITNSLVVTTGMGGIFPSGILIGKVKEISSDHFDLAKTVYVSSEVDFDSINYVTILKRNAS